MRESEEKYRTVIETAGEGIVIARPNGSYFFMNRRMTEMLGYPKEEIIGKSSTDFSYPDCHSQVEQARQNLHKGDVISGEFQFRRKDGSLLWTMYNATAMFNDMGEHIANFVMHTDITERKKAEEAMKQSEERFRLLFENMNEGFFLGEIISDESGKPIDYRHLVANPAIEQVIGMKREDIVGKTRKEALMTESPWIETFGKVALTGQPVTFEGFSEGLNRYYLLHAYSPKHGQFACLIQDITEAKRAEEALREKEQRFRTVVETAGEGIAIAKPEGTFFYINKQMANMLGYPVDEIIGKSANDFCSNEWKEQNKNIRRKLHRGEILSGEFEFRRKDGSVLWSMYNATPMFNEKGEHIANFAMHTDVTERKKIEERLEHANNKINEILNSIQEDFYVLDHDWNFVYASKRFTSRIGKEPEDFLGKNIWEMFPKHISTDYEENIRAVMDKRETRRFEVGGKYTDACYHMTVFPSAEGIAALGADITERKRAEEALKIANETLEERVKKRTDELEKANKSLKEIDMVLKQEIHHRIKNNLQVISSLLDLQTEKFRGKKNIEDSQVLESFKESQDRVISMALIHEELYKGGKLDTLNFSSYVQELAENLFLSYRFGNEGTSLSLDLLEDIFFDMDTAVPLGIIINELSPILLNMRFLIEIMEESRLNSIEKKEKAK